MKYGLPTYPIHTGMILGHREPDELQWLIEHGVFQIDDNYRYAKIIKVSDTKYRLVICRDIRASSEEETLCDANSLMELISMRHLDLADWYWYGN